MEDDTEDSQGKSKFQQRRQINVHRLQIFAAVVVGFCLGFGISQKLYLCLDPSSGLIAQANGTKAVDETVGKKQQELAGKNVGGLIMAGKKPEATAAETVLAVAEATKAAVVETVVAVVKPTAVAKIDSEIQARLDLQCHIEENAEYGGNLVENGWGSSNLQVCLKSGIKVFCNACAKMLKITARNSTFIFMKTKIFCLAVVSLPI